MKSRLSEKLSPNALCAGPAIVLSLFMQAYPAHWPTPLL